MKKLLLIGLSLLLIVGCWQTTYRPFIDLDLLDELRVGDSMRSVVELFGEPLIKINQTPDEEIWEYEYRFKRKTGPPEPGNNHVTRYYSKSSDRSVIVHFKNFKVSEIIINKDTNKK